MNRPILAICPSHAELSKKAFEVYGNVETEANIKSQRDYIAGGVWMLDECVKRIESEQQPTKQLEDLLEEMYVALKKAQHHVAVRNALEDFDLIERDALRLIDNTAAKYEQFKKEKG